MARAPWRWQLISLLGLLWILFQIYLLFWPQMPLRERPVHLVLALLVLFLARPLHPGRIPRWGRALAGGLCIGGTLALLAYYLLEADRLSQRMEGIDPLSPIDPWAGMLLLAILLEGVRRLAGWILLSVILLFLLFSRVGQWFPEWSRLPWLPEMFRYGGAPLGEWLESLALTANGALGITTSTSAGLIFYFVLFGVFYSAIGGGRFFIDIGLRLGGRRSGGAAKAAIISSSLMGSISGSAVANASTTGTFTIPLMRRTGSSAHQAAGVEAIASTGGQLMPPIMGISAFVMAEILQLPYARIALAGLIPALAFYLSLFLLVDLRARKASSCAGPADPGRGPALHRRLPLLIPPLLLVALLVKGLSAPLSAVIAAASCPLVSFLGRRLSIPEWWKAVGGTARQACEVAIPIAAIGLVIEIAVQSNLALKFSRAIVSSGGELDLLQLLTIVGGCLIMGTGLPTVASYIIGSTLFVPVLVDMGAPALGANLFVMYFCVLSMVTPPVAMVSYTAANIAGADAIRTGLHAFRLSWVAFLIPFAFLFEPALLGEGSALRIVGSLAAVLVAVAGWAAALEGRLRRSLALWRRASAGLLSLGIFLAPCLSSSDGELVLAWIGCVAALLVLLAPCVIRQRG